MKPAAKAVSAGDSGSPSPPPQAGSLERHSGRNPTGVQTPNAQRLFAGAACIWHDWCIHRSGSAR